MARTLQEDGLKTGLLHRPGHARLQRTGINPGTRGTGQPGLAPPPMQTHVCACASLSHTRGLWSLHVQSQDA